MMVVDGWSCGLEELEDIQVVRQEFWNFSLKVQLFAPCSVVGIT